MEGGALFDPGFLGGQFLWWVGQIPDDATWRDNINPGVYKSKDTGRGWGRRYKVRIIGIHDKTEESIPSDQLPWANVMYPITAGSGSANAYQTPQIRQGNFVFGFFMDGADQQVPVIMGILGNNPQTTLSTSIGTTKDNFSGTSGYSRSQDPPTLRARVQAPDEDLTIEKPKTPEQQRECSDIPPDLKLNKYGLRPDRPLSSNQQKDAQSAKQEAEAAGLTGEAADEKIKESIAAGIAARCKKANSALGTVEPGASIESGASAPHLRGASSVVKDELYKTKTVLLKPGHIVESSQKAIQTELENLSDKTKRHLETYTDYTAAVSNKIPDMEPEIEAAAKAIAKFEKVSINKMAEYSLKSLFSEAASTMAATPAASRFQYADVQEGFTTKLQEQYAEIGNGLESSVLGLLQKKLDLKNKEKAAMEKAKSLPKTEPQTHTAVDICTSEEFLGESIALQKDKIDKANNAMLKNMNTFLDDITSSISGLTGSIGDLKNQIPDMQGSLTSALQFENLPTNVFPFELPPNLAASDFYTMLEGSGAQPDQMTPSSAAIGDIASRTELPKVDIASKIPFAVPSKDQLDVNLAKNVVMDEARNIIESKGQEALQKAQQAASDLYQA